MLYIFTKRASKEKRRERASEACDKCASVEPKAGGAREALMKYEISLALALALALSAPAKYDDHSAWRIFVLQSAAAIF